MSRRKAPQSWSSAFVSRIGTLLGLPCLDACTHRWGSRFLPSSEIRFRSPPTGSLARRPNRSYQRRATISFYYAVVVCTTTKACPQCFSGLALALRVVVLLRSWHFTRRRQRRPHPPSCHGLPCWSVYHFPTACTTRRRLALRLRRVLVHPICLNHDKRPEQHPTAKHRTDTRPHCDSLGQDTTARAKASIARTIARVFAVPPIKARVRFTRPP